MHGSSTTSLGSQAANGSLLLFGKARVQRQPSRVFFQERDGAKEKKVQAAASLGSTYWRLVEADGKHVPAGLCDADEPHLELDFYTQRGGGFTAVNYFRTAIDWLGSRVRFDGIVSTRRSGPRPAMEVESAMMRSLTATRGYRISGDRLELLGPNGAPVATFEAKLTR
jgi:heat shock protein HslJ